MCLSVNKNSEIKIAETDITVYKIIKKISFFKKKYKTPFLNADVVWKKTLNENNESVLKMYTHAITNRAFVNIGYHSFASLSETEKLLKTEAYFSYRKYRIAECIIPKGAQYRVGIWSDNEITSYVSNQIKYLKLKRKFWN